MFARALPPGSHRPRLAWGGNPRYSFPSSPVRWMLHAYMGAVTVRVIPRAGRTGVESLDRGIVVRVRSAPEGGRATEEARRALAEALKVPPSSVRLRSGARSRTKVFEVAGVDQAEAVVRLGAT